MREDQCLLLSNLSEIAVYIATAFGMLWRAFDPSVPLEVALVPSAIALLLWAILLIHSAIIMTEQSSWDFKLGVRLQFIKIILLVGCYITVWHAANRIDKEPFKLLTTVCFGVIFGSSANYAFSKINRYRYRGESNVFVS